MRAAGKRPYRTGLCPYLVRHSKPMRIALLAKRYLYSLGSDSTVKSEYIKAKDELKAGVSHEAEGQSKGCVTRVRLRHS